MQFQYLDTRKGFQPNGVLVGESFLVEIFSDTTTGIAAHHGFGAVGIEYAHRIVCTSAVVGLAYENQSVAAYSCVVSTPGDGGFLGIGNVVELCVDVYIVVAGSLHLGEMNSSSHIALLFAFLFYFLLLSDFLLCYPSFQ